MGLAQVLVQLMVMARLQQDPAGSEAVLLEVSRSVSLGHLCLGTGVGFAMVLMAEECL